MPPKKELLIFYAIVLPIAFIVCGGIATIIGIQEPWVFVCVFSWYLAIELMIFDLFYSLIKKGEVGQRKEK